MRLQELYPENDGFLRFSLTSGIVFSVILSFVFIEEEIGLLAPVGLVKDLVDDTGAPLTSVSSAVPEALEPSNPLPTTSGQLQWVVNIGGMRDVVQSVYVGGIQIPVYVVLFGIVGGYLRYLYEIARLSLTDRELERSEKKRNDQLLERIEKMQKDKSLAESQLRGTILELEKGTEIAIRNDRRRLLFHRSITDLATLFLSPLLAIAMYFILVQWEPTQTSIYILAVVSFGTGLVTDEIVQLIIRIVQSIIGSTHAPGQHPEGDHVKEEENKESK